jgi:NADH-quinone oxidoreductase subunit L
MAGDPDPMQRALGGFYSVLKHKYYIDEFYNWAFIRPAYWLADVVIYKLIDLKILDGILHAIGRFGPWFGQILRGFIDLPIINGAGDRVAAGTRHLGADLKPMQSGRVQQYLLVVLMVLVVVFFVFYYFFVLA